jgi:integrase
MPLVKRGNSKFWYAQFQIDHRTYIRSTRTTDRKAAEKLEAKLRAEAHAEGVMGKKKSITLGEATERFIASKAGSPNHRNLVFLQNPVLSVFSGKRILGTFTNDDLENYKRVRLDQGRAQQTIKHEMNLILGAIRFAKRLGFEVPDVSPPQLKLSAGKLRYLSLEEETALLAQLDPSRHSNGLAPVGDRSAKKAGAVQSNYDLVVILLDTGARYGEIASLRWDQIDLDDRKIALWRSKVSNESVLFMTTRVAKIFERRLLARKGEFVFTNAAGGVRGYNVIAIRKAFVRAGLLDCSVHTLRHTHASRLIQHGMSVYEVKEVLGHSDIRTTMRYAHLEQAKVTSRARDVIERLNER